MSDADELLTTWLDRVARLEDTEAVDADAMKAVALELGLTEGDLARVEHAVGDHLTRGRNFSRHGRPVEAVGELEQARALAPWRFDVLHALADAQVARFEGDRQPQHRAAAERTIQACVAREPDHQPSYALLARLDTASPATAGTPTSGSRKTHLAMLLGGTAVMTVTLIAVGLIGRSTHAPATNETSPPTAPPATAPPATAPPATAPPATAPPAARPDTLPRGTFALPVTQAGEWAGVVIDGAESELERNSVATYARVKLRARNDGQRSIDELQMRIELVDDDGRVVTTQRAALINSAYPPLRPGHSEVFGKHITTEAAAVAARIVPDRLSAKPPGLPLASDPVCLKWGVDQPQSVPFEVVRVAHARDGITLRQDYAFTNTSGARIDTLKVRVEHLDATGAPLKAPTLLDEELIATGWKPAWGPGEMRRARHSRIMSRDVWAGYDRTCLRVIALH